MRNYVSTALLASAALLAVIYLTPDPAPFSVDNPGPLGASKVAQICQLAPVENATVIIVAPGVVPPIPRPGITLVLLGPDNATLAAMGLDVRVLEGEVRDEVLNALNPNYPLALVGDMSIALYRPQPLSLGPRARAVATTSEFSLWKGASGPYTVAAAQAVSGAEVIVVSSPYVFTNALLDMAQNAQWLKSLCGDRPTAYLGGVVDARAALWRAVRQLPQAIVLIPLVALLISVWPRRT